jgi:hypothetical protein
MAKKVSLTAGPSPDRVVSPTEPVTHGGVRTTAEGAHHGNAKVGATDVDSVFPVVDGHALEAQDANDGTHDGKQPLFSMPAFANGPDVRHRG